MKMRINDKGWRTLLAVLILLPIVELLGAIMVLPDTVAVHWGIDGTPDRYGSRFELLIPTAIILLVGGIFWFQNKKPQPKGARAGGIGALLLFNIVVPMLLYVTFRPQVNLLSFSFGKVVCGLMSAVILVVGNYLPKVSWEYRLKQYGFRTRYSLVNEQIWDRTQRFAGYSSTVAGIVGIAAAIFLEDFPCLLVMIGALLLSQIAAWLYSRRMWKNLEERKENIRQE